MTKNYFVIKPILLLLMLGLSSLSLAAEEAATAPPAGEEGVSQGVPYMTGGIGEDGREIITDKADAYNLKLIFAEKKNKTVNIWLMSMLSSPRPQMKRY